MSLLTRRNGSAFDSNMLSMWFADATEEAGLPDACVMHGQRKKRRACRRRLVAARTKSRSSPVTSQLADIERYTKAADQKRDGGGGDPPAGTEQTLNRE